MSITRTVGKFFTAMLLVFGAGTTNAQLTITPHDTTICGQQLTLTATLLSAQATQVNNLGDDTYSGVINLGFTFNYYGIPYTQVVVGSNGILNFNLANANGYCTWPISAAIPNAPANVHNSI